MPIRRASIEDLDQITELRLRFLAENRGMAPTDLSGEFRNHTRQFLQRQTGAGTGLSWLAGDEAGSIVGVVTMLLLDLAPRPEDITGTEGYIINMYVEPAERRHGVGRELLTVCLAGARDMGLRRVLLYATEDGRRLYASAGFTANPSWLELPLR